MIDITNCESHYEEVKHTLHAAGMGKDFDTYIEELSTYGEDTRCVLFQDYKRPLSFIFRMEQLKNNSYEPLFTGGLIFMTHDDYREEKPEAHLEVVI
jgi:hypothetical protein